MKKFSFNANTTSSDNVPGLALSVMGLLVPSMFLAEFLSYPLPHGEQGLILDFHGIETTATKKPHRNFKGSHIQASSVATPLRPPQFGFGSAQESQ